MWLRPILVLLPSRFLLWYHILWMWRLSENNGKKEKKQVRSFPVTSQKSSGNDWNYEDWLVEFNAQYHRPVESTCSNSELMSWCIIKSQLVLDFVRYNITSIIYWRRIPFLSFLSFQGDFFYLLKARLDVPFFSFLLFFLFVCFVD